jgi:hypothetical protein
MNRFLVKVSDSSQYWSDFEGELCVYYHFIWNKPTSMDSFLVNELQFIKEYIYIAEKYKIAVPLNRLHNWDVRTNPFFYLYQKYDNYYYPTYLFLSTTDDKPSNIISVDPLLTLEEYKSKPLSHGSIPIRIELLKRDNEIKLLCYVDNDVFNLSLENKKCRGLEYPVDNYKIAYLNTPRLNSFLRDIKKLCFQYGAIEFEFENLGLRDFSESGVLFDNEIIYYEDIYDMLPPKNQIVKL